MQLETIIGLEVHVQLKTKSKMFCRCDNRDDQVPNTAICPVCTGQPGALPLPNQQAIDWALMSSLALGCTINQESKFDRKSYFYPDLPKGYQISQFDKPFGVGGSVSAVVEGKQKTFHIHRLHLEEDAGKLIHSGADSLVDLNRTGTPLMEIVSEPDFRSPQEAKAYLQELRLIMRYLGVSDADMEKGHLRCDANISLRPLGEQQLYPKTEIKNLNSFKAVERALTYEVGRQTALWEDGQPPSGGSTRGWDEQAQKTVEQRTKEEAADYRYFPEPDVPPIITSNEHVAELQGMIPELPAARRERLVTLYGLKAETANALVEDKELADYFEEVVSEFRGEMKEKHGSDKSKTLWEEEKGKITTLLANFILNRIPLEHRLQYGLPHAGDLARLLWMTYIQLITVQSATAVYVKMVESKTGAVELVKQMGLEIVQDIKALEHTVTDIIDKNEKVVAEVKAGKTSAIQFLVGQVMKAMKGKASPSAVMAELKKQLGV